MLNKSNYDSIRQSSDALPDSAFFGRINYAPINELKLRPEGGETAFDTKKKRKFQPLLFPFRTRQVVDIQLAKSTRSKIAHASLITSKAKLIKQAEWQSALNEWMKAVTQTNVNHAKRDGEAGERESARVRARGGKCLTWSKVRRAASHVQLGNTFAFIQRPNLAQHSAVGEVQTRLLTRLPCFAAARLPTDMHERPPQPLAEEHGNVAPTG